MIDYNYLKKELEGKSKEEFISVLFSLLNCFQKEEIQEYKNEIIKFIEKGISEYEIISDLKKKEYFRKKLLECVRVLGLNLEDRNKISRYEKIKYPIWCYDSSKEENEDLGLGPVPSKRDMFPYEYNISYSFSCEEKQSFRQILSFYNHYTKGGVALNESELHSLMSEADKAYNQLTESDQKKYKTNYDLMKNRESLVFQKGEITPKREEKELRKIFVSMTDGSNRMWKVYDGYVSSPESKRWDIIKKYPTGILIYDGIKFAFLFYTGKIKRVFIRTKTNCQIKHVINCLDKE